MSAGAGPQWRSCLLIGMIAVPAWSCRELFDSHLGTDGRLIAYESYPAIGETGPATTIVVMHGDGTNKTGLPCNASVCLNPHWSPDGMKLAFDTGGGGGSIMNADGSGAQVVLGDGFHLRWSRDGSRILFIRRTATSPALASVYSANPDGSDVRKLVDSVNYADWSPDGKRIVLEMSGTHPDIAIVNADGTSLKRITTDGASDMPAWSPDGKSIVCRQTPSRGIVVIDTAGATVRVITAEYSLRPSWSPDGKQITFTNALFKSLYRVNADGSHRFTIAQGGNAAWHP